MRGKAKKDNECCKNSCQRTFLEQWAQSKNRKQQYIKTTLWKKKKEKVNAGIKTRIIIIKKDGSCQQCHGWVWEVSAQVRRNSARHVQWGSNACSDGAGDASTKNRKAMLDITAPMYNVTIHAGLVNQQALKNAGLNTLPSKCTLHNWVSLLDSCKN